jgi:hypothetical protein
MTADIKENKKAAKEREKRWQKYADGYYTQQKIENNRIGFYWANDTEFDHWKAYSKSERLEVYEKTKKKLDSRLVEIAVETTLEGGWKYFTVTALQKENYVADDNYPSNHGYMEILMTNEPIDGARMVSVERAKQ